MRSTALSQTFRLIPAPFAGWTALCAAAVALTGAGVREARAQTVSPAPASGSAAPQGAAAVKPASPRSREPAPVGPGGPSPRLADGHPDFTGLWRPIREKGKPGGNIGKDQPGFKLPFTPAGAAAFEYNVTKTIDPEALCILGGIPRHDASGLQFEIVHHPRRIVFLYVYNTHRLIPIDGRQPDPDPDPKYFGNSISHWEGDTLVIDSNGFKDSKDGKFWMDENGDPQSSATHVVERWSRPDKNHIHVDVNIDDPVYYTRPFTFSRTWVLGREDVDLEEYACNENNKDAGNIGPGPGGIGANGNRGEGYGQLPDNPPPPWAYDAKSPAPAPKAP